MRFDSNRPLMLVFAVLLIALGSVSPALAADQWKVGDYSDFTPDSPQKGAMRLTGTTVKLNQTSVHRPTANAGEDVLLRADYDVAAPGGTLDVKETRIIRYNGAKLSEFSRVIARTAGRVGSESKLSIPSNAAPGFYTVTTIIEPAKGASSASKPTASAIFYIPEEKVAASADDQEAVTIKIWPDKQAYKVGDPLRLMFETNKDAYVTLVNIGTTGKVSIIYPNEVNSNNQVKGKTVYSMPPSGENYEITLSGPAGVELVYALVTVQPIKFSEADFGGGAKAGNKAEAITRDLNLATKRTPVKDYTKALLQIEVAE